jgi:hypothetical protein
VIEASAIGLACPLMIRPFRRRRQVVVAQIATLRPGSATICRQRMVADHV